MKIKSIFTLDRFWCGVRLDPVRRRIYWYPLPLIGFLIQFGDRDAS